jgi:transcription elongation factor Elf1
LTLSIDDVAIAVLGVLALVLASVIWLAMKSQNAREKAEFEVLDRPYQEWLKTQPRCPKCGKRGGLEADVTVRDPRTQETRMCSYCGYLAHVLELDRQFANSDNPAAWRS